MLIKITHLRTEEKFDTGWTSTHLCPSSYPGDLALSAIEYNIWMNIQIPLPRKGIVVVPKSLY